MSGDPSAVLQAAKNQLTECDREIGAIRAVLRGLGPAPADTEGGAAGEGGEPANELTVEWLNPVRSQRSACACVGCVAYVVAATTVE